MTYHGNWPDHGLGGPGRALVLALSLAGLAACVPTTTTSTKQASALKADVPTEDIYLATADNGFKVPAVPVEKVPDQFERQVVDYQTEEVPGTIIINPAEKHLYFVTGRGKAIRYGIAVGKAGFEWHGVANVTNRKPWPMWTPPPEMIDRKPELAKWENGQPGGPTNPLGARALYLTTDGRDYGYRIHGTPDWWSIGKNASSGCIRMINQDVMDLYNRVPDGAKVIVLTRDGQMPKGLKLPPPAPRKKKPEAEPAVLTEGQAAAEVMSAAAPAMADGPMSTPIATPSVAPAEPAAVTAPLAPPALPAPAAPIAATPVPQASAPGPSAMPEGQQPAATPVTQPAEPLAQPTAPACAVALVNGVCPQG